MLKGEICTQQLRDALLNGKTARFSRSKTTLPRLLSLLTLGQFCMYRYLPSSRRSFLKALGLGAAVLPLLEVDKVLGQLGTPKRSFILAWCNGMMNSDELWPEPGANPTLPEFMQVHEPHKQDMIFLNGLNYRFIRDSQDISETTGHAAYPGMLTGALYEGTSGSTAGDIAGGISLDQYMGNALRDQGYQGLVSLNLGVKVDSTARLSWRGAGNANAIVPNEDPYDVFDNLFAGALAEGEGGADPEVVRINAMRASILDYLGGDLQRFSASLGTSDRARIDGHLTSIRELELEMQIAANNPVNVGAPPTLEEGVNVNSTEYFHTVTDMQMRLSVAAFAADITRVIVLQLGDQGGSNIVITPLGFDASNTQTQGNTGLVQGLHVIAHDNGADKMRMDGWFQLQIANMIQLMKDTPDPTGAVFDSSVLLAMNNMRTGNHETNPVPAILAGSMGGYFATGRSLATDVPNNAVLVSLANAMGIPTETFGNAEYGGELSDLRA